MSMAESTDEYCRVPACGRTAVGYLFVGSHGRREVYVGHPGGPEPLPAVRRAPAHRRQCTGAGPAARVSLTRNRV